MCRHLAYLGPPIALADLLFTPPHGLVHQSWAPRDMRGGGTINADGFGVGWYPGSAKPVRYRQPHPIWSDESLVELAASIVTGAAVAAVRSASVGMPVTTGASAPFAERNWLFSHNGLVADWPESMSDLAEQLPVRDLLTLDAATDAALLWALVRHRLRGGAGLDVALAATVADVLRVAPGSRLNLLLTDGRQLAATTRGHSLWWRRLPGGVLVASEPLDEDESWTPVPEGSLVYGTSSGVAVKDLGEA